MKTFGNVLLTVLTAALAVLLCLSSLFAAASACVRTNFTPEAVYRTMDGLDYAELQLPDGYGGFDSLCGIANQMLGSLGVSMTPDQLNAAVRNFSVDDILTAFLQDLRTWLLDDGPVPQLSSYDMAKTIANGLDPSLAGLLSLFGDPALMISGLLDNVLDSADLTERLRSLEPAREILSKETLVFALSVCAALFLLILLCRKMRFFRAAVWAGCSCATSGALLLFAEPLAKPIKNRLLVRMAMPESTLDLVYLPLMKDLRRWGLAMLLAGLAAAVIAALIVFIGSRIRRSRQRKKEAEEAQFDAVYLP